MKGDAGVWEDYLTYISVEFKLVAAKNNKAKVKVNYLTMIAGYQKGNNKHERNGALEGFGF